MPPDENDIVDELRAVLAEFRASLNNQTRSDSEETFTSTDLALVAVVVAIASFGFAFLFFYLSRRRNHRLASTNYGKASGGARFCVSHHGLFV